MNLNRSLPLAVASVVASSLPSFAQDALPAATNQAQAIIQKGIAPKVPGLAVAVAVNGAIVWSQGFGYADLAAKTPVTTATRFRIGSVSKPLTSAGLALLVERGLLDMDAPVQKYIPDFPQKEGVLTVRLLAGHLSGIRNYRWTEATSNKPYPNLRAGLKIFENDPLESPPGTKYSYSSYNWNVIGVAMEAAAKQDFLGYMHDNVFQPLGMSNTRPDLAGVADAQRTKFYEANTDGSFPVAPEVNLSYVWPAGGFLSTAEDLIRFGSALSQPGFLKAESRNMLFTSQATSDGTLTHYGVGWFVGRTLLYHKGDSIGGTSVLLLLPSARTVVAIACNRGNLLFSTNTGRLTVIQRSDFNIVTVAQSIANAFAALYTKPAQTPE